MKINIAYMDGDGGNDVVLAGKGGLYILYHKGYTPTPRLKNIFPPESTYPTWIPWNKP